ncbi:MAG: YdeI/OmpD-associated family protein, partial [Myxococcota bacterium]
EKTGALVGDRVTLRFNLVDASQVTVPPELEAALSKNRDAQKKWNALTPGKRRTWAVFVDRAKRRETRMSKAKEVVDRVLRGLVNPRDPWP